MRVGDWVMYLYIEAVIFQFVDDVSNLAVTDIRAVFLESEAQHQHGCAQVHVAGLDHLLDGLLGNV